MQCPPRTRHCSAGHKRLREARRQQRRLPKQSALRETVARAAGRDQQQDSSQSRVAGGQQVELVGWQWVRCSALLCVVDMRQPVINSC